MHECKDCIRVKWDAKNCCVGCKNLTSTGCGLEVKPLSCRMYLCDDAQNSLNDVDFIEWFDWCFQIVKQYQGECRELKFRDEENVIVDIENSPKFFANECGCKSGSWVIKCG